MSCSKSGRTTLGIIMLVGLKHEIIIVTLHFVVI